MMRACSAGAPSFSYCSHCSQCAASPRKPIPRSSSTARSSRSRKSASSSARKTTKRPSTISATSQLRSVHRLMRSRRIAPPASPRSTRASRNSGRFRRRALQAEAPDIATQRATLGKERTDLDTEIKRAKLLSVDAQQLFSEIAETRRSNFQARLTQRTVSPLTPAFWKTLVGSSVEDRARLEALGEWRRLRVGGCFRAGQPCLRHSRHRHRHSC